MQRPTLSQSVTFLYAAEPEASWRFYEEVMGLDLVQDQGACRIYAAGAGTEAFLGVCRARAPRASSEPRAEGGVVFTFVSPDVEGWRDFLQARGVEVPPAVEYSEAYRVTHFFLRDPAGYLLEVQRFEREDWPAA
jgi:catechol 2,3-dioxygenase-like lactoylglutathione lyase family enzyme